MTRPKRLAEDSWQRFVLAHGWRVPSHLLATILDQHPNAINAVRSTSACVRHKTSKGFAELFGLWHGRAPAEDDWPVPRRIRTNNTYEWLPPEDALLATLVGTVDAGDIATILTNRLRRLTGDPAAERTRNAVILRTNRIGLQSTDVVGGITTNQAAREIGSLSAVQSAIAEGHLNTIRVGRLHVIPHDAWTAWKATRVHAPEGYIPLASIRDRLAIRSDKLSEFARMGYIPGTVRANPYGTNQRSTRFGTWYIDAVAAEHLIADRVAGRPMPWHGKPLPDNLRASYKRWQERRHPDHCQTCRAIWGPQGGPQTYDDFAARYQPLDRSAKRHLTRRWNDTMAQAQPVTRSTHPPAPGAAALPKRVRSQLDSIAKANATHPSPTDWLLLNEAALDAGVSSTTVMTWVNAGGIPHRTDGSHRRYHRDSLRDHARSYWQTSRFHRASPPAWLLDETAAPQPPAPASLDAAPHHRTLTADDKTGQHRTVARAATQPTGAPKRDNTVMTRLSSRGHVIVALRNGRYLVDGIRACSMQELAALAAAGP